MPIHPPLTAIRAFVAAARHSSFKDAAFELGLTPTAISHQIKQLETQCRCRLFLRRPRHVELTPEGRDFAETAMPALDAIASAFDRLRTEPKRQQVTLGAGSLFASRWLVPRLPDFWSAYPSIDLWLHQSPVPVWRRLADFDLAVAWGQGNWPDIIAEPLLQIDMTPVLSPSLLKRGIDLTTPEDLLSLPLLHYRDCEGWHRWLATERVSVPKDLPGTIFEDANVLLQAALSGRGVALGAIQLIEDELAAGRVVQPFPNRIDLGSAYYLVCRKSALANSSVASVREWMLEA
ncbi:MAG: LysR substrate-binding domain-containing protein [Pseudomonadota bacterium]